VLPGKEVANRLRYLSYDELTLEENMAVAKLLRQYTYTIPHFSNGQLTLSYALRDNFAIGAYHRAFALRVGLVRRFNDFLMQLRIVSMSNELIQSSGTLSFWHFGEPRARGKTQGRFDAVIGWKTPHRFIPDFKSWACNPNNMWRINPTLLAMVFQGVAPGDVPIQQVFSDCTADGAVQVTHLHNVVPPKQVAFFTTPDDLKLLE
jgi:hypothetical protein